MTKETKINFIDTLQLAVRRFIRFYCGYLFWIFEDSLKRVERFIYPIVKITSVVYNNDAGFRFLYFCF
jgi:hypothetical protein